MSAVPRERRWRRIRRHRLVETLLLEHLGYSWHEVHDEVERLERAVSDLFTERMAEFLQHPGHDPHGDPIPAANGSMDLTESIPLSSAADGDTVRICRVSTEDSAALTHLGERRLAPGRWITVEEVRKVDGVTTVRTESGDSHALGEALASVVLVEISE